MQNQAPLAIHICNQGQTLIQITEEGQKWDLISRVSLYRNLRNRYTRMYTSAVLVHIQSGAVTADYSVETNIIKLHV